MALRYMLSHRTGMPRQYFSDMQPKEDFSDYEKQNKLDGKYSPQFSCMWRLSYAGGMFKLQSLKLTPTIIQPISFNLLSTCGSYVLQTPSIALKGPWTRSNEGQLFERSDPS